MLKTAVLAPMPRASVSTAAKAKPGLLRRVRNPNAGPASARSWTFSLRSRTARLADFLHSGSMHPTSPNACMAASLAACGGHMPASMNSWVRISRWKPISLRTSRGTSRAEPARRKRRRMGGA